MRVLQLTSHLEIGGISSYVVTLSEQLKRRGHDVVVASERGLLLERLAAAGVPHWRLPLRTSAEFSPQVAWGAWQLDRRLRREPVDLIHAHTRVAQVIAEGLWRLRQIPYVTTWHGIYRRRLSRRWLPATGRVSIAISEPVMQHLLHDFRRPADSVRLIFNSVDSEHFSRRPESAAVEAYRRRWRLDPAQPTIGSIGRFASGGVKGLDLILAAARALQDAFPGLQVVLAGDGPRRAWMEEEAKRLGIRDRVRFVGATADVRLPLAVMDVFVFPSRWPEAFGLALIEAMATGRPVVASAIGAIPGIVRDGRDGLLVPSDDVAALGRAITRLLQDRESADRLGAQAQRRVREAFSLDRLTDEIEAVYRDALQR